jgi:hypothetical protein
MLSAKICSSGGPFGSIAEISAVASQSFTGSGQTDVNVDKNYVAFQNVSDIYQRTGGNLTYPVSKIQAFLGRLQP